MRKAWKDVLLLLVFIYLLHTFSIWLQHWPALQFLFNLLWKREPSRLLFNPSSISFNWTGCAGFFVSAVKAGLHSVVRDEIATVSGCYRHSCSALNAQLYGVARYEKRSLVTTVTHFPGFKALGKETKHTTVFAIVMVLRKVVLLTKRKRATN